MVQQSNQTYFVREGDELYTYVDGEDFLSAIGIGHCGENTLCVEDDILRTTNGEAVTLDNVVGCVDQPFDDDHGVETDTGYWLIEKDDDVIDTYIQFVCSAIGE